MNLVKHRVPRPWLILGLVAILALAGAVPAFATNSVVQTLTGGTRTASIADLTLDAVAYSHSDQDSTGAMTLTADDSTGTGEGWNVTVQSSAFAYSGSYSGSDIPAANFSIGTPGDPSMTAGQAVDVTNGPKAGVGGSLDAARKVIYANAGYGMGTYDQSLPVTLTIPGQSKVGTYTGTLTVTITSGPGA